MLFFCNFSFLWTVAILSSFGFLIYSVTTEFIEYRSLPTITKTEYVFFSKMNFPAVTICSTSPRSKKRAITNSRKDNYWMNFGRFLYLAEPINWSEPEYEAEGYFKSRTEKDIFNEAIQVEDLLMHCSFEGNDCFNEFQPVIMGSGVCYTFNRDGKFSTKFSDPAMNLKLLINVNEDDMTWSFYEASGIMVSVNSLVTSAFLVEL